VGFKLILLRPAVLPNKLDTKMKWLLGFAATAAAVAVGSAGEESLQRTTVSIPGGISHPTDDIYHCVAHKAPEHTSHVVQFEPLQSNYDHGAVHHMIVFGCEEPYQHHGHWDCEEKPPCGRGQTFLAYAWAMKAPKLHMPKNSGFVVGGDTKFKYFVVQQHFKNASPQGLPKPTGLNLVTRRGLPNRFAGMATLAVENFSVPGGKKRVYVNTKCRVNTDRPITLFAYRTHAHDIGRRVIGHHNGDEIVNHSPQLPQAFNRMSPRTVKPGDTLKATCLYDSSHRNRETRVGPTHLDEMCNLYYMFFSETPAIMSLECDGGDHQSVRMERSIQRLRRDNRKRQRGQERP